MSQDKVFVNGMIAKRNANAPEWALVNLSLKVDELIAFLQQHNNNGWVNVKVNRGQTGNIYAELDTWRPNTQQAPQAPQQYQQAPPQQAPAFPPPQQNVVDQGAPHYDARMVQETP